MDLGSTGVVRFTGEESDLKRHLENVEQANDMIQAHRQAEQSGEKGQAADLARKIKAIMDIDLKGQAHPMAKMLCE